MRASRRERIGSTRIPIDVLFLPMCFVVQGQERFVKSLLLKQSKSGKKEDGDVSGSSGAEEVAWDAWQVASLHRETWLIPSLGSRVEITGSH